MTELKSRPIIFSAPMVRAILDGRKTQTRRIVKPQPSDHYWSRLPGYELQMDGPFLMEGGGMGVRFCHTIQQNPQSDCDPWVGCPFGRPGDRLWVRETGWERPERTPEMMRSGADTWARYYYDADGLTENDSSDFKQWGFKHRSSIFMPRWASRITLEITDVRVERLRNISDEDALAEGVYPTKTGLYLGAARLAYGELWDQINGPGAWGLNPWVWVLTFRRVES